MSGRKKPQRDSHTINGKRCGVKLPQTSMPNPDEAASKEMQGFGDDVIDTGAYLDLNDDKCTDDIVIEEVSAGGEIPSAIEEQVNTTSADITDIGVSTAAPKSVNAADESQIEKEVAEVVTIAKIIVEVSKDAAAEVISTAGIMPVKTVNIKDLSTAGTKVSAAEPVTTAIEEDTEETLAAFLTSLKSSNTGSPKPSKPKEKGVTLREPTETAKRPELPKIAREDKGKEKLKESEKPKKIKQLRLDQELSDAELAAKLHVEELEKVRLEEERIAKEAEDLKAQRDVFDDVKSQIGRDIGDSTAAPESVNAADES
ncbi:hypothetical protein Tco_0073571 [Tanacetum coccineum]